LLGPFVVGLNAVIVATAAAAAVYRFCQSVASDIIYDVYNDDIAYITFSSLYELVRIRPRVCRAYIDGQR